jgi:ATP-dependent 26S proteasome regulatory subunit
MIPYKVHALKAENNALVTTAEAGYGSSLEHILAELERIDVLIETQVARARQLNRENEFQGLYISEQEVEALIARPLGLPRWATQELVASLPEVQRTMGRLAEAIASRKRRSAEDGVLLRLELLTRRMRLSDFDVDVLLLCLAGELDLKYERLYAYLQDDVTRKRPGVDLALNLLCSSLEEKLACRLRFSPSSPLVSNLLITVQDDTSTSRSPLLNRLLKADDRVINYLLGEDDLDGRIAACTQLMQAKAPGHLANEELVPGLASLAQVHRERQQPLLLLFEGPHGVGKRSAAQAICHLVESSLLIVDAEKLFTSAGDFALSVRLVHREAALVDAAVYWHGLDRLLTENRRTGAERLCEELQRYSGIVFLGTETDISASSILTLPSPSARVEFPYPAYGNRLILWHGALAEWSVTESEIASLANKFRFTAGQIQETAGVARNLAIRRSPQHPELQFDDLLTACHQQSNRKLNALATRTVPHYRWADIVLPADRMRQLREICAAVEYRSIVYDQWGFDEKLSLGKGLNLLFAGPSGTGKTMAAEVIAHELGLELYRIDLSMVISKYIGETEKNLSRIFDEAATSNAVLFFDEADALFGKRSEVRDSHDRYANIEINYLLQKMEQYQGTVILATNLRKNMDDAFVRRIQFTIEFPFPGFEQRLAIWQRVWPAATPREPLDLEFLARRFEITGGNIRNIALSAAFLAAEEECSITMKHLIRATWQEHQKMGKVMMDHEFGEYGAV